MKTRILIFSFFLIFIIVGCSNLKTQQNETNNSTNIINKNSINTNISPTNQNLDNSVPDSVIDKIVLGNIYEFKGSVKKYNDIVSIKYLGIKNIVNCKELENEINTLVKKANYCEIDSDCTYKPNLGFVKGCDRLFNINEDLTEIILKEKMFFDYRCQSVEISCIPHNRINLKCENNKCVSISNN